MWKLQVNYVRSWDDFKLDLAKSDHEEENISKVKKKGVSILLSDEEILRKKQKGSRISYRERAYLYSFIKKDKKSKRSLAIEYCVSQSTLYNIMNEFDNPTNIKHFETGWSRIIIGSPKIQSAINDYLCITKTPWASKDIVVHVKNKMGILISERIVRIILSKELNMNYKKGLSRIVNFEELKRFRANQLFSIKLWKIFERFSILINVDESSFSRLKKKEFTWNTKRKKSDYQKHLLQEFMIFDYSHKINWWSNCNKNKWKCEFKPLCKVRERVDFIY